MISVWIGFKLRIMGSVIDRRCPGMRFFSSKGAWPRVPEMFNGVAAEHQVPLPVRLVFEELIDDIV